MKFEVLLLDWFEKNKRAFPWRETNNIFYILLAEIFLRRTLSSHVEKIYTDFINLYSTPEKILKAPKKDIMCYLNNLGLQNQRYEVLINVCKKYINHHNDFFKKEVLKSVDGLGEYIINATLCFGKGERLIIYDANTRRIIKRFYGIEKNKDIKNKLNTLLPKENYIKFNYSLLDFGGLICKARFPRCNDCFLRSGCHYNKLNN